MLQQLYRMYGTKWMLTGLVLAVLLAPTCGRALAYEVAVATGDDPGRVYPASFAALDFTPPSSPAPQPAAAPAPMKYSISPGDTLYNISRMFDISVDVLTAVNQIQDARSLRVGQELLIPGKFIDINLPAGAAPTVSKVLVSTLTAYTAGVESTGKRPSDPGYGVTYSGSNATEGRTIAVDPKIIPIGTKVFIDGIGVRTAEDTGSAIRGARIDVFMNDLGEAVQFGVKKNVLVYVLGA